MLNRFLFIAGVGSVLAFASGFLLPANTLVAGETAKGTATGPPQTRGARGGRSGVYKTHIVPHWFDDGKRFWYRNDLSGRRHEFILIDAEKGERNRAFDHERLAKQLATIGIGSGQHDRLEIENLQFDSGAGVLYFRSGEKTWRCDLDSYQIEEVDKRILQTDIPESAMHPDDAPRASLRTGRETELNFVNQTDHVIELFWLDPNGERRGYGKLAAGEARSQHTYAGHVWLAVDAAGTPLAAFQAREQTTRAIITGQEIPRRGRRERGRQSDLPTRDMSPDGAYRAFVRDHNVYIKSMHTGHELQLSTDGEPENAYQMLKWAPDSQSLVAFRVQPGDQKEVFLIESSPDGGGRAILHQRPYALPGDAFTSYELNLFRRPPAAKDSGRKEPKWVAIKPKLEPLDLGRPRLRWSSDGQSFTYAKVDRGHQRYRLIHVDPRTGKARNIIDEVTDTFIWTAHAENVGVAPVTWLEETDEVIYASEVDGWRHLYLVDLTTGSNSSAEAPQRCNGEKRLSAPGLKHQITNGDFVVRGVDRIDEAQRQIWFRASGIDPDQDPYVVHHCRVNFDGTGFVRLTEGHGDHSIQFSPDRRYLIDTYSRVDLPPVHELRRVEDGALLCKLESADVTELEDAGWQPPEVFVAKARDGKTDIWGLIYRPRDFDPDRKYPVIEEIYAGPHGSFVPKRFSARDRYASLTELGFVVVKIDGMGTANRFKEFHDVCWHNLKDAGFPDRIKWLRAAAAKHPYLDLSRVGIYGGSAGGQNAAAAVLFHPEVYHVAVAGCGCHDNRMDKASWNEQWMGYPVGPQYATCSNIDNAHRLGGKLLLIVGELDRNVPPESTLRFADALIKADKDFDMLVVPGAGHGMGGEYGRRRMHDFFVRHLVPDRPPEADPAEE